MTARVFTSGFAMREETTHATPPQARIAANEPSATQSKRPFIALSMRVIESR